MIANGVKPTEAGAAKTVIALFDNSLSMQWEKLERNFQALESLLHSLKPTDQFNLLLFNTTVSSFTPAPGPATPDQVEKALAMVRASRLRGGTDLEKVLDAALSQSAPDTYLVLLSDGGATRGIIQNGKLAAWYAAKWKQKPAGQRPHTYIYAVGDDANMPLLRMLARNDGVTGMGALHGARGFQAEGVSGEDRPAARPGFATHRRAGFERQPGLSARRQHVSRFGEELGRRIQARP